MGFAILSLISNTLVTSLACVGIATVVNKVGKFFKIIDEHKKDGFKVGFDTIMIDSIDELNKCVESLTIISCNFGKICVIMYDISMGNKFIKKDKNGKIIICNKSKLYSGYKDKIDELTNKVKKYETELKKMKVKKPLSEIDEDEDDDNSVSKDSDKSYSDVSSDESDNEDNDCQDNEQTKFQKNDDTNDDHQDNQDQNDDTNDDHQDQNYDSNINKEINEEAFYL